MLEYQSSVKPRQISELEMKALPQQALPLSNAVFASGNFSRENNATLKQKKMYVHIFQLKQQLL